MLIANFLSALFYLVLTKTSSALVAAVYPNVAKWVWNIYGLLALANLIFIISLFMWKKWSFFALCGTTVIAFIMNLAIGEGIIAAIYGVVGILILYFSMKSRWNLFE